MNTVIEESTAVAKDKPLVQIENLFRENEQFTSTILRFAGLIGGRRHPGRFFSSGKTIKDPDAFVNLIHRDDCIAIITKLLEKKIWGEVFNGCADSHPKKRDYYPNAARAMGAKPPSFDAPDSISYKIISNHKIKQRLNYTFLHADLMDFGYLNKP